MKLLHAATCMAALWLGTAAGAATFVGDEATFQLFVGASPQAPVTMTVNDIGTEASYLFAGKFSTTIDVRASEVFLTFEADGSAISTGEPTTWTVTGLDAIGGGSITGVTAKAGNPGGASPSYTSDSLTFLFSPVFLAGGARTFGFDVSVAAVPVPASLPLMLAALGGLGAAARRRTRATGG